MKRQFASILGTVVLAAAATAQTGTPAPAAPPTAPASPALPAATGPKDSSPSEQKDNLKGRTQKHKAKPKTDGAQLEKVPPSTPDHE